MWSAPEGSRTPNPQLRRLMLYPVELQARQPIQPSVRSKFPLGLSYRTQRNSLAETTGLKHGQTTQILTSIQAVGLLTLTLFAITPWYHRVREHKLSRRSSTSVNHFCCVEIREVHVHWVILCSPRGMVPLIATVAFHTPFFITSIQRAHCGRHPTFESRRFAPVHKPLLVK
jgi:hypothetical protein